MVRLAFRLFVVVVLARAVIGAHDAGAAEIDVWRDGDTVTFVTIIGTLDRGDEVRFRSAIAGLRQTIVSMHSPGGNLITGLEIGKTIRLRGFATAVIDGAMCVSACALAWLGGQTRLMGPTAFIGFHAASIDVGGIRRETGVGNALVGAYLTNLGLSEMAVYRLTEAPPDDEFALTPEIAADLGIDVVVLPPAGEEGGGQPPQAPMLPQAAVDFVRRHMVVGTRLGAQDAGQSAQAAYDDVVDYYGSKAISRDEVVASVVHYAMRYPRRSIDIVTIEDARCDGAVCAVSGIADFGAEAPERNVRSTGRIRFRFGLRHVGSGTFRIMVEEQEVLSRRSEPIDTRLERRVRAIQAHLARLGCDPGPVDGIWGQRSRQAAVRFRQATRSAISVDGPTTALLKELDAATFPVCQNPRYRFQDPVSRVRPRPLDEARSRTP